MSSESLISDTLYNIFCAWQDAEEDQKEYVLSQCDASLHAELNKLIAASQQEFKLAQFFQPVSGAPIVLNAGDQIRDYVILGDFAKSPAHQLYLAAHKVMERRAVIKISRRPTNEGKFLGLLNHPHIVTVFDAFFEPSLKSYVTVLEYIDGEPLSDCGVLAENSFLDLAKNLLQAMKDLHKKNIIHCDIKPANILCGKDGSIKLADFNTAQFVGAIDQKFFGGTRGFMSPEQQEALAHPSDSALAKVSYGSDIYSFGKTLQHFARRDSASATSIDALIARCTEEDLQQRICSVELVEEELAKVFVVHRLQALKGKVHVPLIDSLQNISPHVAIFCWILLPNGVAAVLQILYNKAFIIERLSDAQMDVFKQILLPWNLLVFAWGASIIAWCYAPFLRKKNSSLRNLALIRRNERVCAGSIASGWICGFFLFATALQGLSWHAEITVHLAISFGVALILSLGFAYLLQVYLDLKVILPQLLATLNFDIATVQKELRSILQKSSKARYIIGGVPLISALLLDYTLFASSQSYGSTLPHLIASFTILGAFGFVFGAKMMDKIQKIAHFTASVYG